ncbi:MAG: cytidine deaminase [Bacteroidota bacterium]
MQRKNITTVVIEYDSTAELSEIEKKLVEKARESALQAYSPYSKFQVGAAVLLDNGLIIEGNNQENAAYPSGLCAERVALFYANARYPKNLVTAIAITALKGNVPIDEPVPPCGSCRQTMLETANRFGNNIKVILAGKSKIQVIEDSSDLLPLHFNEKFIRS